MQTHEFPHRRTPTAEQADRMLIEVMAAMLNDNETITARAVARRVEGIEHASSLTRDAWRSKCLATWKARQEEVRRLMERVDKTSKTNVAATLEKKERRIRELEEQVAILSASHRAMIHAVGEMGGMRAWSRFFKGYNTVLEDLRRMRALPSEPVSPLVLGEQTESTDA